MFKKVSKPQNASNKLYFNEHCTFYFKARKLEKVIEFDNILQKVKYNVQKNSSVDFFPYKLKNVLYKLRNA